MSQGYDGVEPYMPKVKAAIERHLPSGSPAATDIYNRAYEAIWAAIQAKQPPVSGGSES